MRILFSLLSTVLLVSNVVADDLKFAIYGDWGVGQNFIAKDPATVKNVSLTNAQLGHLMSLTEKEVVSQFQNVSDVFKPKFILSTGDQFYDDGLFDTNDPQFTDKFKNVYTSPGVNVTWYPCLGNHDYYQNPNAELNRKTDDWRWNFPSKYHSFSQFTDDGTEALFVVLDVTPGLLKYRAEKGIKDANAKYYRKNLVQNLQAERANGTWAVQLKWAEKVLTYSKAKWKFVMAHEPIYATTNGNSFWELQQQLQPILERTGVSAVFAGHFHTLDITENNNIAYIISGAASQIPYPVGNGTREGLIDYFNQNNITGVYDPSLSNVTPIPTGAPGATRYPPDAPIPDPANPQKNIFHGGDEQNLPGFMNARLNQTHLSIDVWGMYDNHTWAIVYQYVTLRVDLKPKKQIGNLKFNIIGDWGVGPDFVTVDKKNFGPIHKAADLSTAQFGHLLGKTEAAVAAQFQNVSDWFYPQFVISTGDQFYDNGLWTHDNDPQFVNKFSSVYNSVGVQVPWYPCLGNHDYYINPDNELNQTLADWRWQFPSRYYNFSYWLEDGSEVLFVVMDVNPGLYSYRAEAGIQLGGKYFHKQIVQLLQAAKSTWNTQLIWAETVLNTTTAKWKIVVGHEPIYTSSGANAFGELQRDVQPILERTNVTAYLSGHFHTLELLETNNVEYIISGAASQIPYPIGNGTKEALLEYFAATNVTSTPTPDSTYAPPQYNTTQYPVEIAPTVLPVQYKWFVGGNETKFPGFMTASINAATNILHIDVWALADNQQWSIFASRDILRRDLKTPLIPTPTTVPTTGAPTTGAPTTQAPTTQAPTTNNTNTNATTAVPSTAAPTTAAPTTTAPTTLAPTTRVPTSPPSNTSSSSGINNPNIAITMTPMWGVLIMLMIALLA